MGKTSGKGWKKIVRLTVLAAALAMTLTACGGGKTTDTTQPVSYTHLDVYKRQLHNDPAKTQIVRFPHQPALHQPEKRLSVGTPESWFHRITPRLPCVRPVPGYKHRVPPQGLSLIHI